MRCEGSDLMEGIGIQSENSNGEFTALAGLLA